MQMKHDMQLVKLVNDDEKDKKITELLLKENYAVIKDIYNSLLEKSPDYPLLMPDTVFREFFALL